MLASVQHSPVDLSGVPLGQEGRLTLGVQELEHLTKTKNKLTISVGSETVPHSFDTLFRDPIINLIIKQ